MCGGNCLASTSTNRRGDTSSTGSAASSATALGLDSSKGDSSSKDVDVTYTELRRHSTPQDCWIHIDGHVYDVTTWGSRHPGGSIIFKFGGADASDQFAAFHRSHVRRRLLQFRVGRLVQEEPKGSAGNTDANADADAGNVPAMLEISEATEEYRSLRRKLWDEGYFKADPTFYARRHLVWLSLFIAAMSVAMRHPSSLAVAAFGGFLLGLAWQQVAFIGHDAGHYGVTEPTKGGGLNWLSWFTTSVMFGISTSMWNEEHSMHHAITLRPREDPQFDYLPIWLISTKELDVGDKAKSNLLPGGARLSLLSRLLISVQHFTFLPLCVFIGRFNLHIISVVYALKRLPSVASVMDLVGMAIYFAMEYAFVVQLPTTATRVVFALAANWVAGILHVQLMLSHLATETFTEEEERAEGWAEFQLRTSRNIECKWYENWFHGGLEYQIEHHLFPQLPRHNLDKVKPMVEAFAKKHGIVYRSVPFTTALAEILTNFRSLAKDIVTLHPV
mmetsp:Transcript_12183/g.27050  ORF Transcript_12183/g.27050 Transcript_12183/m.27050 type:complete len:503 (-) Transcript_12183:113-1621(-)